MSDDYKKYLDKDTLETIARWRLEALTYQKNQAEKYPNQANCDHGIYFDEEAFKKEPNMPSAEVRRRWPRGWGPCSKGCGWNGIFYASHFHFVAGDW